ncbi:cytochrome P450 [Dendrothele bispora CBS 962.96]|uniref:Cytochrome P450 n=1 Tax=Dendrothele bispora (strain CBS 962.96) TaxID=1314807 RepID=A0A4S8MM91_DENBC|nr:cytochrome P450 [Dendrothele bispora CBS 962.96]
MIFSSLTPVVGTTFVVVVFLLLKLRTVWYNLFLHPLKNVPGPKLAAATDLYKIYYDLIIRGGLLEQIEKLHKQYGPVIRIAPNVLHFNDERAYYQIYGVGSTFTKDPELYSCFAMNESSFTYTDPEAHRRRVQMINPFFSRRAIVELENVVQEKVDKFITRMISHPKDRAINMFWAFRCASVDVITSYVLGQDFHAMDHPYFSHPFPLGIQRQVHVLWVWKYFPFIIPLFLSIPKRIMTYLKPLLGELAAALAVREQVEEKIERFLSDERALEGVEHEVIWHHLIGDGMEELSELDGEKKVSGLGGREKGEKSGERRGEYDGPSKNSLLSEALILTQAGSDTVGNTCYLATFYILNDPSVYHKLKEELRQVWPDKETRIGMDVLEKLPYLNAVLKESLRLGHGVVTPLPRVVGPGPAEILGVHVPAGTIVGMSCTFLHYDPRVFPDPYTFKPERWLPGGSSNLSEMEHYLRPFSNGPRQCLGQNLAWAELYLIMGYVFRKLDLTMHDTSIDDFKHFKELFVPSFEGRTFHAFAEEATS